ncbi:MAG TPA: bacteriohemerythrin [Rectinemataceae bacterium]|nr:bacteriohemerythrin [Rectinemataceae bacterium]
MPLIEWPGNLMLGIPSIDEQHRVLVVLLNRIHEGLCEGQSSQAIETVIDELTAYASMHFAEEEHYLDRYNLPSAEAHRLEHRQFMKYVEECRDRLGTGDALTRTELIYFLAGWITRHIGQEDHRLVRVAGRIRSASSQPSPAYDEGRSLKMSCSEGGCCE